MNEQWDWGGQYCPKNFKILSLTTTPLSKLGYRYIKDLLSLDECRTESRAYALPPGMEAINTPLDWRQWEVCLADHPDDLYRNYIIKGIRDGFRIGFDYKLAPQLRSAHSNMQTATQRPEVIRTYLAEECSEGRVLGPLDPIQYPFVHTNRFGVIPKGSSGKWWLIVDMSAPEGTSVNDGVSKSLSSLSYVGVQDAVEEIQQLGHGALLAKVDIRSTYRHVLIHPDDRWLTGMIWEGALFIDTALPFRLRSAPKIFTALADAAEWILRRAGVNFILHYLDDFLIIGAPNSPECQSALRIVMETFARLGFPIAVNKLEGPTTCLDFLGFELDSQMMEVRLPREKLSKLQHLIHQWVEKKSCTLKELQSLTGKLGHAAKVVEPGKTFMRRMFELQSGVLQPYHHIRLNKDFRSDIRWWDTFLETWNGISMILPVQLPSTHIWTDASGGFGCGAWEPVSTRWIQMECPDEAGNRWLHLDEESIDLKELLPIILACAIWGKSWNNTRVTVHCDNLGTVALVNSGYSKVPQIMHLLRCLFFIRAHLQIQLWAVHVPGIENILADAISRNNLCLLYSQIPESIG